MSQRDPDYLWVSIQVFAGGIGAVIALGLWWAVLAAIEAVERWWGAW